MLRAHRAPGRRETAVLALASGLAWALGSGCGSPGPAASNGAGGTITIVSGETGLPIAGAEVAVRGQRYLTDAAGRATVAADSAEAVDVVAEGFLSRQTRVGADRLSLWPIGPDHGPEYVRAIVYRSSAPAAEGPPDQPLQRLAAGRVLVAPSGELARDARAIEAHRAAAAELSAATEGAVVFTVGGSASGAAVFKAVIDPTLPWLAATYRQLRGSTIEGGRIAYGSLAAARSARYATHELGHVLGLQHSVLPSDLMYFEAREGGPTSFTAAERVTIRLLLQRPPGNRYPDNDRDDAWATADVRLTVVVD